MSTALGVQLYTLREEAEKDFIGTLRRVKEIGYHGVELAGYGGLEAAELKKALDELELIAVASHVSLEELENNLEEVMKYNLEIGSTYIVCPWLPEGQRKEYQKLAQTLNQIGEGCREKGLQLCYHHHEFEFELEDGKRALDILLTETDPRNLQLELDVYWTTFAHVSTATYLQKYEGRTPLMHLKDMTATEDRAFAEVGTGIIDITAAIEAGKAAGVKWFFVEQDVCQRDPFESIKISYENLKAKGY